MMLAEVPELTSLVMAGLAPETPFIVVTETTRC